MGMGRRRERRKEERNRKEKKKFTKAQDSGWDTVFQNDIQRKATEEYNFQ